ncbi:hypothetical protein FVW20_16010 [Desulfovibrio oxamicus]|uniref:Secreted protein n=1 Tax=Nitratidesulfovibrio oxamicus TaxID=32016 RepID=A0ABS0J9R1_9BACT|nr:hypothetical protein [Nitratidesulfovibrio oxamicus]
MAISPCAKLYIWLLSFHHHRGTPREQRHPGRADGRSRGRWCPASTEHGKPQALGSGKARDGREWAQDRNPLAEEEPCRTALSTTANSTSPTGCGIWTATWSATGANWRGRSAPNANGAPRR